MRRLVAIVICCLVGHLVAFAQSAVWSKQTDSSTDGRIARDSASNIYLITRGAIFSGRELRVRKFNAVGDVLWDRSVEGEYGPLDLQFSILEAVVQGTTLYFARHVKDGNGSGVTQNSRVYAIDTNDGSTEFTYATLLDVGGIAVAPNYLVVVGRTQAGNLFTDHLDPVSGASLHNRTFTAAAQVTDVCVAADGTAYIAVVLAGGTSKIVRAPPTGLTPSVDFDDLTRTNEQMLRIVLDEANSKVYGYGKASFSPTDSDVIVYSANTDLTGPTLLGYGGGLNDNVGGISVIANQGVIISYSSESAGGTIVRRLGTNLATVWTNNWPARLDQLCNLAFDIEGNPMIVDYEDGLDVYRVTKLLLSSGSIHTRFQQYLFGAVPLELVADPAGNAYVNTNYGPNVVLARLQPAKLDLSNALVSGSTAVTGTLSTLRSGGASEVWALSSSNSAVASVPASATLPANGFVDFNIATTPVTVNTNVTIAARYRDHILQKVLTVFTPTVSNLTVTPNVVVGGNNATGTVHINGKAPIGGKVVSLSSSLTSAATTPASTSISAGSTARTFIVTTYGVSANKGVVISATTGAVSKTFFMAVNAPSLTTFTVSPSSVKGGTTTTLTVGLNGKAPTGGWKILTYSGAPSFVVVPADVTVIAGQSGKTATLTTTSVTSSVPVTIFGTRSGIYKTVTLTLTP